MAEQRSEGWRLCPYPRPAHRNTKAPPLNGPRAKWGHVAYSLDQKQEVLATRKLTLLPRLSLGNSG